MTEIDVLDGVDFESAFIIAHTLRLASSYLKIFGHPIIPIPFGYSDREITEAVFWADHAILTHDIRDVGEGKRENYYNYANAAAIRLFERSLPDFQSAPSVTSAATAVQTERNRLLGDCLAQGALTWSGERVTATGRTVYITEGKLFNIWDDRGVYRGQGAVIDVNNVRQSS